LSEATDCRDRLACHFSLSRSRSTLSHAPKNHPFPLCFWTAESLTISRGVQRKQSLSLVTLWNKLIPELRSQWHTALAGKMFLFAVMWHPEQLYIQHGSCFYKKYSGLYKRRIPTTACKQHLMMTLHYLIYGSYLFSFLAILTTKNTNNVVWGVLSL
jgi:hypothetical protein